MTYEELYDLVVIKGGVDFGSDKPRRSDLEGTIDEIDPELIKGIELDTIETE